MLESSSFSVKEGGQKPPVNVGQGSLASQGGWWPIFTNSGAAFDVAIQDLTLNSWAKIWLS